jgi:hypothetical protein
MAVYNLQALADKTKYLMSSENKTQAEAEAQVFKEAGIEGMDETAYAEYTRLVTTGTNESPFARNDGQRLLDRRATANYGRYEEPTQEPPQEPQV